MAVPSSGQLSLYGLAKEKELNNYDNTIPISTYNSYYATPISLGNMATGAGGFDATNEASIQRPNPYAPHVMSEWYGYDHDYVWMPYYGVPINKTASYSGWVQYPTGSMALYSYVKSPTWFGWTVDNTNVYETGSTINTPLVIGYDEWGNYDVPFGYGPDFVTNGYNRVRQMGFYSSGSVGMYTYLEATSAYLLVDVVVSFKYGAINSATSVLNNQTYIYVEWYNTTTSTAECYIDFKVVPNPIFQL